MLVNEIISICLDLSKVASTDDSFIDETHVFFLLKKYRSFLLKKEHDKEKSTSSTASEFEYQEICLTVNPSAAIDGSPCTGGYYLRTEEKIPKLVEGVQPVIYPVDYYQGTHITYIPRERMRYVGTNKYLQNIIYVSLGPDTHLYAKSSNPQFMYLKQLRMTALFEDFEEAAKYSCSNENDTDACDIMNLVFPIRESLVPMLIDLVVKEITGAAFKPKDVQNNASDDLSDIIAYLRRNVKSPLQKQIES